MTLDIPDGYANAIFGYRSPVGGKGCSWAMGYNLGATLDNSTFSNALTALSGTNLGPALHANWDLISFTMEDNVSRFETTFESAGTAGGNAASPQVSALFKKTTGVRGRPYQGRAYIPAGYLDDDDVASNGLIDAGAVDDLNTLIQGVITDIGTAAGADAICIFHTDTNIIPTSITDFSCESLVATQRRRLR